MAWIQDYKFVIQAISHANYDLNNNWAGLQSSCLRSYLNFHLEKQQQD